MRPPCHSVRAVLLCAFLASCCVVAGKTHAQDAPEPPKPPMFGQLFPQPTGMNGYEEWVQAGDLIQNNKLADDVLDASATLTMKRRLLADPHVQTALHLLHVGLSKPIQTPRQTIDADTLLPEYAVFRKLARLLYVEIYVQFADGRIDAAIDTLDDGLRFGYRMQTNTLLSGLVGVAVDAIVLRSFSQHLDQLSEYQCLRVRHIIEELMDWPSPVTFVLRAEQQNLLRLLDTHRADPKGIEAMIDTSANEADWDEGTRQVVAHLRANPAGLGDLIERAKARTNAYYDAAIANSKLPRKERQPVLPPGGDTLDAHLFALLTPTLEQVNRKYDDMDAKLRLLGVHAAIRAYRWEHNHLPQTLAELHLRDLAVDPHTGNLLRYQNNGATYDLFSSGAVSRGDDGKPDGGPSTPVRL